MSTPINSQRLRLLALSALFLLPGAHAAEPLTIDVHRDANCGCCKSWIRHLEDNGFHVIDYVEDNMSGVKQGLGVPHRLASCHTGVINGKFVEGHVPAAQVIELTRRNDLAGVAVPGMPKGSPGMEAGGVVQPYEVIGLTASGTEQVIAEYPGN
jgi:hypothetical protein